MWKRIKGKKQNKQKSNKAGYKSSCVLQQTSFNHFLLPIIFVQFHDQLHSEINKTKWNAAV